MTRSTIWLIYGYPQYWWQYCHQIKCQCTSILIQKPYISSNTVDSFYFMLYSSISSFIWEFVSGSYWFFFTQVWIKYRLWINIYKLVNNLKKSKETPSISIWCSHTQCCTYISTDVDLLYFSLLYFLTQMFPYYWCDIIASFIVASH